MFDEPGIEVEFDYDALAKAGPVRTVSPEALHGKRVSVYRNLHNGLFSVWHQGRVLAHVPEIHLKDVQFRVRESGRQKVLREKRKNVHAFVIGTVDAQPSTTAQTPVTYNPYMHPPDQPGSFVRAHDKAPVATAPHAHLAIVSTPEGKQRAQMNIEDQPVAGEEMAMKKAEEIDPAPAPTPAKGASAQWFGRPIVKPEHAADLEREAALDEFHHKMPRAQAEEHAHLAYQKRLREEAAAHHLAGMRGAHAAGDLESARKHAMMYELHSKALGHDHVGPAHPSVVAMMESKPFKARFKAHHGDVFAVADHAAKERDFDEKPLNVEGEDPSGKANDEAKHHPLGKALVMLYDTLMKGGYSKTPKFLNDEYKRHAEAGRHKDAAEVAMALHHFHSEALHGSHGNHNGDHDAYHDDKQKKWHDTAKEHEAKAGVAKGEIVGHIGNPKGAEPQPKHKTRTHDIGIGQARKWARDSGVPIHPNAPKYGDYFKDKDAKKAEMKAKVVPCRCDAYHHPHRAGGGRCGAK